ncbi:3-hydroxyacyl-CoA dehydrogenase NAD-binding domain-containing protein [Psychrobacter sp.]|uniref:3-hydroxyacyl-CoA dehydrogenase NAD-binding domain-containing protein n=1 Tax=Psychrobacter sp. TaxID=56811 RepID=UPI003BAFFA70
MENITILGAGTMGHSIALSAAWANQTVNVYGIDEHDIANAVKGLNNKLKVMTENELFTSEQANEIRKRVQFTPSLEEAVAEATFIIEVIPEILDLKKELYGRLEALIEDDVVIARVTIPNLRHLTNRIKLRGSVSVSA